MQFDSIAAFIDMGGYGFYVWLSYGSAFLLFALLLWFSLADHKQTKLAILKKLKRDEKLRQRAKNTSIGETKQNESSS